MTSEHKSKLSVTQVITTLDNNVIALVNKKIISTKQITKTTV